MRALAGDAAVAPRLAACADLESGLSDARQARARVAGCVGGARAVVHAIEADGAEEGSLGEVLVRGPARAGGNEQIDDVGGRARAERNAHGRGGDRGVVLVVIIAAIGAGSTAHDHGGDGQDRARRAAHAQRGARAAAQQQVHEVRVAKADGDHERGETVDDRAARHRVNLVDDSVRPGVKQSATTIFSWPN